MYANNPGLKYGTGQSILNKALSKAGVIGAVTGIYANYSDSSLVGFFLAVSNSDAVKVSEMFTGLPAVKQRLKNVCTN